jgi:hypothetical protein
MSKKSISIQVNIPSDYLTTHNSFKEYAHINAVVNCDEDGCHITIKSMTFRGCMAFAIKPECIAKFVDLVEDMIVIQSKRMDDEYATDELFYYEIAEHGL